MIFAVTNNVDGSKVFVVHGEIGYYPCKPQHEQLWVLKNTLQGEKVTQAALVGSMFGWDVPAAKDAML